MAFTASAEGGSPSSETVWLTAIPGNEPNSRRISFTDLTVAGVTDSVRTGLLIELANASGLSQTIADSLTQNFTRDYYSLLTKVSPAIEQKRLGDFLIHARINDVRTGQLKAAGQGVYLPVGG